MNAGDPIRHGFKLCSRCGTWVLNVTHDESDPVGLCPWVCTVEEYCKRAQEQRAVDVALRGQEP